MKRIGLVLLCLLLAVAPVYAQGAMLPEAFPQFLDINGNPLSSGTLSFFLTGTSTPTTVYSDSALTTPTGTAGVITLDAGGRPPTAVYLAVQPYKVVLKDSGGITIATRDPVSGAYYLGLQAATPTIQTTTSTGTVNDFALSSTTAPLVILRCNNATDLTITGFVAGVAGQRVIVQSVGAGNVFFQNQTGSAAANRLINFSTNNTTGTPLAAGFGIAEFVRDGTTARWRMVNHDQGAWITPTFAAGSYTGPTWTVGSADVVTQAYWLKGRSLDVAWYINTTTVAATPAALSIGNAAWGAFTVAKQMLTPAIYNDNGAGLTTGYAQVVAGGTAITINKLTGGTFGNATDTTGVYGQMRFEVQD